MEQKQLSNSEIAGFTHQMAMILHAGISAYEGMAIMKDEQDQSRLSQVCAQIYTALDRGDNFTTALKSTNAFPEYMLNMVDIGETAGRLEEVMNSLSDYYERLYEMEENVTTAISYPMIMIILMFVVVIVLLTQVIPIFNRVFDSLGANVSGFAKGVMNFGNALSTYSWILVILFLVIIVAFLYFRFSSKGQKQFNSFLSEAKFSRKISMKMAVSKFAGGMAIALSSGLDLEESLEMSKQLVDHKLLKMRIEKAEEITKEKDLSEGLVEARVLTGIYARLIKLGYKTGGMDQIFANIAKQYDQETNESLQHAIGIIEPTLVAILSVITGIILLSVMLPLVSIMGSL
jgi:type IV pilus assembly protein PilC